MSKPLSLSDAEYIKQLIDSAITDKVKPLLEENKALRQLTQSLLCLAKAEVHNDH